MGIKRGDEDGSCAGKRRFKSYWSARRNATLLSRFRQTKVLNVYRCPTCKAWHVGNSMKSKRRRNSRHTERLRKFNG